MGESLLDYISFPSRMGFDLRTGDPVLCLDEKINDYNDW